MSQLVSTIPAFPGESDSVTIIFDASMGSGGLAGYNGDIYAHTGVISNLSNSPSDWKHVKTNWGQNTADTKLSKVGNDIYQLKISPDIRQYYGVPTGETILKMAFVFRSGQTVNGSYLEGKTADGSDIFVDIYQGGLQVKLSKPSAGYGSPALNDTLYISAQAVHADSVFLWLDNSLLKADTNLLISDTLLADTYGKHWIKAMAKDSTSSVADSFYYFVRKPVTEKTLPPGITEGINYLDSQRVVLCFLGLYKDYAFVLGDFNGWQLDTSYYMYRTPDHQYFWLEIDHLVPGKEYIFQYLVDGEIYIGDPYAEKVSDPWNDAYIPGSIYPGLLSYPDGKARGIATVLQTAQEAYQWKNTSFTPPKAQELVVYELLVRDFSAKHNFLTIIDSLHYLKTLGINAIELMPVNEFEGNSSWGYNPNYYFAVDKYYGHARELKALIDSCHSMGIAVIFDVVYNHAFGTNPYAMLWWDKALNRPSAQNPFFNPVPKHDYNVGNDFNHESPYTRAYISRALKFWTREYKADGFRFDLSKGFTQNNTLGNVGAWGHYDATRIYTLNRYADTVWHYNPKAYIILEHFADNSEEKELSRRGMMLWGNMNGAYAEAAMGYNEGGKSDFSGISYQNRGWTAPHLVGYMESHDEERLMYKCKQWGAAAGSYSVQNKETYLQRASLDAAFFLSIPGPKMIWQFGELGYDISINYNGRTGEKPIKWEYTQDRDRWNNYLIYQALTNLRKEESACFQTSDFSVNASKSIKYLVLNDSSCHVVIVGNFDIKQDTVTINLAHDGSWYDYFTGQEIEVQKQQYSLLLEPGEYHLLIDKPKAVPSLLISPPAIKKADVGGLTSPLLYPNPSTGTLQLKLSGGSAELTLSDMSGKVLFHTYDGGTGARVVHLDALAGKLQNGLYLLHIQSEQLNETKKLIKL